mgnify:CR=1 FL=1
MRYGVVLVFGLLLVASGCGSDGEDPTSPPGASAEREGGGRPGATGTGGETEEDRSNGDDSADPNGPVDPDGEGNDEASGRDGDGSGRDAEAADDAAGAAAADEAPELTGEGFEAEMARVRRLTERAAFERAMELAQRLRASELTPAQARELAPLVSRLSRYRAEAPRVRYAIERLGSGASWEVREAARDRIINAGELGRLLLQELARERAGKMLASALELLERRGAWASLPTLIERVVAEPDSDAGRQILRTIEAMVDDVPPGKRGELSESFAELFALVQRDADFRRRRIADLFATLAGGWMQRDYAKLNAYLGIPEAAVYLESYFRVASEAGDNEELRRLGLTRLLAFTGGKEGLAGWWAFDDVADGRVVDRTGGERDGRVKGASVADGKYGGALRFDGEDDLVRIPDAPAFSGGKGARRTVSVVFKTDGPARYQPIVEKQWDGGNGDWGLSVTGGELVYYSEAHVADYGVRGGKVEAGRWTHAVMTLEQTHDRFEVRLYQDGKLVATGKEAGHVSADTNGDVYVGARRYENKQDKGQGRVVVDDLRIYDRRLDDDEASTLNPGAYLWNRNLDTGHEAAGALVESLRLDLPPTRERIVLTALRRVCRNVPPKDRPAYRPALRQFIALADPRLGDDPDMNDEVDELGENGVAGDAPPTPWRRTVELIVDQWFDDDEQALRQWLEAADEVGA